MKYFILLIFCSLLLVPSPTDAGVEDRMTLVRALLGEAGWRPRNDHPAILHVLERRRKNLPAFECYTLTEMAQAYANFLDPDRDPELPHRAAIKALNIDTAPGWAVKLVDKFLKDPNSVKDPCRGKAWHWGATWEVNVSKKRKVDCGYTLNVFTTLKKGVISVARR